MEELTRSYHTALEEIGRREKQEEQFRVYAECQKQAMAEQAQAAQDMLLTPEQTQLKPSKLKHELKLDATARALQEALDQRSWLEQQLEEIKRQCDQFLKEKGASPSQNSTANSSVEDGNMAPEPAPIQNPSQGSSSPTSNSTSHSVPDFAALIKESVNAAVAAAFVAQPTPRTSPSSSPSPHSSQRGNQVPKPGKDEKRWRDYLRSCFRDMSGQPNITDFRSYCPIEDTIAEAFETDNGPGPSNITQYCLHFGNNYQKSRWNKYVVSSMLAYTAARKEQYRVEGNLEKEALETFFHDFIKEAQTSWARYGHCHYKGQQP
ncbi:hypothetical protein BT96DRAFT_994137 [Gymnopus androsaceus JB14]|uniref:Uncharacterized protein n=1 Tax=Gymnopus androsaceus JB14 TaxID=1447944 RepID=A0A6A4HP91_9AGAR|nr:hypothetical protein BT96DRAFT_994137 [Gymnopus androsaceus JB14]